MRTRRILAALTAAAVAICGLALAPSTANSASTSGFVLNKVTTPDGLTQVLRWNPCQRAINFKVNTDAIAGRAAKRRAIRETRVSVRRLARATQMRFVYRGRTHEIPRAVLGTQRTELVVAFVRPGQTDLPLRGSTAGYGGISSIWNPTDLGTFRVQINRGYVVVDHPQTRRWSHRLYGGGVTRPALLLHELGHAVGLQHVSRARQIMYPSIHPQTRSNYALGDRRGLRKVGRPAGCIG